MTDRRDTNQRQRNSYHTDLYLFVRVSYVRVWSSRIKTAPVSHHVLARVGGGINKEIQM